MNKYGMPYKGSKSKLANFLIDAIPQADVFVDLFAGGCAVTHKALESKDKFKKVLSNDLLGTPDVFRSLLIVPPPGNISLIEGVRYPRAVR